MQSQGCQQCMNLASSTLPHPCLVPKWAGSLERTNAELEVTQATVGWKVRAVTEEGLREYSTGWGWPCLQLWAILDKPGSPLGPLGS